MKIAVLDGNSLMNRAFYGIRLLTNSAGVPTNALLGFDGTKIGFQTNLYTWYLEGNKRLLVWFTLPEGETGNSTDRMTVLDYTIEPLS